MMNSLDSFTNFDFESTFFLTNIRYDFFLSASKRQPRASTDRFLHFFPKKYTFPKKFPFCQFYPQTTIPYPSTDRFLHFFPKKYTFPKTFSILSILPTDLLQIAFSTFAKKNSILSILPQTAIPYLNLNSTQSPSRAYWPKTLSGLFTYKIMRYHKLNL